MHGDAIRREPKIISSTPKRVKHVDNCSQINIRHLGGAMLRDAKEQHLYINLQDSTLSQANSKA